MGKSKIRIRRQVLNPLEIDRHKDYSSLLRRHERERRRKRFVRFVTFSILITLIVLLFLTIISYLWFDVAKRADVPGKVPVQIDRI